MNFRSQKKHADQIYMGEPIETDGDGNQLTLMDIIDDGTDLPELVDTLIQSKQLYTYLKTVLEPREVEILVQRYGLYGSTPMTQREVAKSWAFPGRTFPGWKSTPLKNCGRPMKNRNKNKTVNCSHSSRFFVNIT